ncbi:MAG: UDP-N-acetylmuramate dehydrogenase [Hymenobacteraceae bacterium]|nr:UDP-N-acetylmuramate dehydrogenase [Hymenobacteraceae bacterium]
MLEENVSLRPFNTFGMDVRARLFARFSTTEALQELLRDARVQAAEKLILGGGSNLLLTQDVTGVVLKNEITEVSFIDLPDGGVLVRAGGGGGWHELVERTLDHGLGGLENLSLIPGTVGAAPLQNIGAYGVELKDVFEYLDAVEIATGAIRRFNKEECAFGYRESIFKRELKGQFVVTYVGLRLRPAPTSFRTDYGDIRRTLTEMQVPDTALTARHVSAAVQAIRRSKLPDPAVIGNAGSFFKNPGISVAQYEALKARFADVPGYATGAGRVKVPAGWLIEQAGWKGHGRGAPTPDAAPTHGVHDRQALVLVNHGGARGADVWALAQEIIHSVERKFGVALTPEVNVL